MYASDVDFKKKDLMEKHRPGIYNTGQLKRNLENRSKIRSKSIPKMRPKKTLKKTFKKSIWASILASQNLSKSSKIASQSDAERSLFRDTMEIARTSAQVNGSHRL